MHNIKFIRENLDSFKKKIKDRNTKVDIDELLNFDIKISVKNQAPEEISFISPLDIFKET